MCPAAACPMCGQPSQAQATGGATICARCGAVLGQFDSALAPPTTPETKANAAASPRAAEWAGFLQAVVPKALLTAALCAVGGVGIAFLLAPVLDEHFRAGIVGAAYFGGQLGFVFAFLWFGLDHLDAQLVGGGLLGLCVGLLVGLVNIVALSQTSFLPDVSAFEAVFVGVLAGFVTGIFVAMLRGDN